MRSMRRRARENAQASDGPVPLLYGKRDGLEQQTAAQYAGTETELDTKISDVNAKQDVQPVFWRGDEATIAGRSAHTLDTGKGRKDDQERR